MDMIMTMLKLSPPKDTDPSLVPPLRITRSTSISAATGSATFSSSLPSGSPKLVTSSPQPASSKAPAKKRASVSDPHKSPSLRAARSPALVAASPARSSLVKRTPPGSAPRKSPTLSATSTGTPIATKKGSGGVRTSPPPLSIESSESTSAPLSRRGQWLAECERLITDLGLHREAARGPLSIVIDYNDKWRHDSIQATKPSTATSSLFDSWLNARDVSLTAVAHNPESKYDRIVRRCARRWVARVQAKKGLSGPSTPFALSFADNSWLARLLLCPTSPSLRSEAGKLVTLLCQRPMDLPVDRAALAKAAAAQKKLQKKESLLARRSSSNQDIVAFLDRKTSTDSTRTDDDKNDVSMDESLDDLKRSEAKKSDGKEKEIKDGKEREKKRGEVETDTDDDTTDDDELPSKSSSSSSKRPQPPTPSIVFMFLELFVKMLRNMDTRSAVHSEEFFTLFHYLLNHNESHRRREFVVIKGIVPVLVRRLNEEVAAMGRMENSYVVEQITPVALSGLASLLSDLVATPSLRPILRREGVPQMALNSFLKVRGLVLQRSRATEECSHILQQVVKSVFSSDSDDDKRAIFKAYIGALEQQSSVNDKRTVIFILEQICQLIKPERPERHCLLHLKKAATQEDLIPGSMKKNPYSSKDFEGPLMLHVKNKILRDLGIDGGPPVDLLVNNRIINFDLPIIKVYDKVWRAAQTGAAGGDSAAAAHQHMLQILANSNSAEYSSDDDDDDDNNSVASSHSSAPDVPMIVTYRLTGLDGEATEDKVDTLPDDAPRETDPEKEFAVSSVVLECDGLRAFLSRLAAITDFSSDLEYRLAEMLIKTLGYCCKLQSNRRHLLALEAPPSSGSSPTTTAAAGGAGAAARFHHARRNSYGNAAAVAALANLPAPLSFRTNSSMPASPSAASIVPPSPTAATANKASWTARDVSSHCLLSMVKQLTRVLATKSAIELAAPLLALIAALLHQAEDDRLEQAKHERAVSGSVRRGISGDSTSGGGGGESKEAAINRSSSIMTAATTGTGTERKLDSIVELDLANAAKQLTGLLACLSTPFVRSAQSGTIVEEVMRVVPSLTFGQPQVNKVLLDLYQPYLVWTKFDATGHRDSDVCSSLLPLSQCLLSLPTSDCVRCVIE
jgi:hypothetical protein